MNFILPFLLPERAFPLIKSKTAFTQPFHVEPCVTDKLLRRGFRINKTASFYGCSRPFSQAYYPPPLLTLLRAVFNTPLCAAPLHSFAPSLHTAVRGTERRSGDLRKALRSKVLPQAPTPCLSLNAERSFYKQTQPRHTENKRTPSARAVLFF